ncbi:uncharacterized protein PRCAT00003509001 [Priceomyces carsonii]|uniref:uncharacterized protein n=1 Tax=Priceomyces carsonii TaxID=28549 RepID=UPI002EDA25D4|nr:unnamed protein product [Priceomyces carsonii]
MIYSEFTDNTTDPVLFETWKPKIAKYLKNLEDSIVVEYLAPAALVPDDLDKPFNATLVADKVLSEKELDITSKSACCLAKEISEGKLSSLETFNAFARRAIIAHQLTNCAMEFFIDEGRERAKALDAYFKKHGKTVGPLHGLPISLKEHYNYKGRVTHGAYVSLIENVTESHATTVQNLYDAGAVFYVRTTEPQSLMHLDSINLITGRGRNPYNTSLGPGGSSSGEGIIVRMGGSSMGVGTDIGGSIRAPSAFCGCWGLKPTQKRISLKGCSTTIPGQETVYCLMGPISRFSEDLSFWMKSVIEQKPWKFDSTLVPLPWREVPFPEPKKLRVAISLDDGIVRPHPPIERGLKYVKKILEKNGVEVVEIDLPRTLEAFEVVNMIYSADSNKGQLDALGASGEPLTHLTKWAMGYGKGTNPVSVYELRALTATRDSIRDDYLELMEKNGFDFILGPTYAGVAPVPDTLHYWGYTALWNLLDMPNVIFPTGLFQDPSIDLVDEKYIPRNDIEKYEYNLYKDPEVFRGAPISLQLTARRYDDEELCKFGEFVDELLKSS